jgi:hypothetical protein
MKTKNRLIVIAIFIAVAVMLLSVKKSEFKYPMSRYEERSKLLTFGVHVTPDPKENPIDPPERFTGFHTALDLEIFDDEKDAEVPVYAICSGKLIYKASVNGYGGVMVQQCTYKKEPITVLYGHLDLSSADNSFADELIAGDQIAILGDHKSFETSDTRKHLHLGIHKGPEIFLSGYVQDEKDLEGYLNPEEVISSRTAPIQWLP